MPRPVGELARNVLAVLRATAPEQWLSMDEIQARLPHDDNPSRALLRRVVRTLEAKGAIEISRPIRPVPVASSEYWVHGSPASRGAHTSSRRVLCARIPPDVLRRNY